MSLRVIFQPNARLARFDDDRTDFLDRDWLFSDDMSEAEQALAGGIQQWETAVAQVCLVHGPAAAGRRIEAAIRCPGGFSLPLHTLVLFWRKVELAPGGCWVWAGARNTAGRPYGRFNGPGHGSHYAHRLAYQIAHGPLAARQRVFHTCRNPACLNPSHLVAPAPSGPLAGHVANNRRITDETAAAIRDTYTRDPLLTHPELARRYGLPLRAIRAALRQTGGDSVRRRGCRGSRHPNTPFLDTDIQAIRAEYRSGVSQADLARRYGVSPSGIHRIVHNERWKHLFNPENDPRGAVILTESSR